ncbi:hypothetical protein BBD42_14835 [Paenibacillus sp. BIHB 4019]|uniref:Uncharacterized protein n=1 Tax=Paenibacillus sp. BIHB 4019 TaxID=1870819 RepID=A0A1B2DIP6_9BACL|nr:hypothetical protein [Paenibacillus sp. BIHB 4019]ANY67610.1 hypothetical protein BBD42_14835 [Paenibacillus sp. BIHB 4019]
MIAATKGKGDSGMGGVLKIIAIGCLVNGMLYMPLYRAGEISFAEQALFFGKYFGITAAVIFILAAMIEKVDKIKQKEYMEKAQKYSASLEQRLHEMQYETSELKRARLAREQHLN